MPDDEKADYWLYAYALFPIEYSEGGEEAMDLDAPDVTAVGSEYDLVGYDVVSRSGGSYFECSPLSCNMLAEATEANRYSLSSDLSDAWLAGWAGLPMTMRFPVSLTTLAPLKHGA